MGVNRGDFLRFALVVFCCMLAFLGRYGCVRWVSRLVVRWLICLAGCWCVLLGVLKKRNRIGARIAGINFYNKIDSGATVRTSGVLVIFTTLKHTLKKWPSAGPQPGLVSSREFM